jgi:putative inorganic carbon (HCO3(-)) transporter
MAKDKDTITGTNNAWYDKGIKYCLYGMVVLIPAVFFPWFYTVFSMPKLLVMRLLSLIIILLLGCKIFTERSFSYKKCPFNILLFIYAGICILNTIFSIAPLTSLFGAASRFMGIFTVLNFLLLSFFVFNFVSDAKEVRRFFIVSIITSVVLSFYGLVQYLGFFKEVFHWSENPAERIFSTIGQANHFGAYVGMNILLGLFLFPHLRKGKRKWLLAAGLGLMLLVVILTASRGAIIATVLAILTCAVIIIVRRWEKVRLMFKKTTVKILLAILILAIVGGFAFGRIQELPLVERTVATINVFKEGSLPDRLSWWMSTLQMIHDRPLLGFGLATYSDAFNMYRRTDYKTAGPGDMQDTITPEAAHNEYLNMAATQGLIGLVAYLAMIYYIFWRIDTFTLFSKKAEKDFYLILGVKGALMVYLLQIFVSFGVIGTSAIFYIMIGLAGILVEGSNQVKKIALHKNVTLLLAILITFISCVGFYFTVREAYADYSYKLAKTAEVREDFQGAMQHYQDTVFAQPFEYVYRQAFAQFALKNAGNLFLSADEQLQMLKLAEENYQSAAKINEFHPSTFHNFGLCEIELYMVTKDVNYRIKGLAYLKKAIMLGVNNPLYPYQAAKVLFGINESETNEEAKAMLRKVLEIRPGYRDAEKLLTGH